MSSRNFNIISNRNRTSKSSTNNNEGKSTGNWTKDGDTQKFLENLFDSNLIGINDKPIDIYNRYYDKFKDYAKEVFYNHFSKTKALKRTNMEMSSDKFGNPDQSYNQLQRIDNSNINDSIEHSKSAIESQNVIQNYMVLTAISQDEDSDVLNVIVRVKLPDTSVKMNFELDKSGDKLVLFCDWTEDMYNTKHPSFGKYFDKFEKIGFNNDLSFKRETIIITSIPYTIYSINLPVQVDVMQKIVVTKVENNIVHIYCPGKPTTYSIGGGVTFGGSKIDTDMPDLQSEKIEEKKKAIIGIDSK
mmetsp:Transcript_7441/g.6671  ORF Transcript_7441/g.6671 Transcript_7441/m.6671 type:complete len:301 (+) Transcript_7441:62-964(+)